MGELNTNSLSGLYFCLWITPDQIWAWLEILDFARNDKNTKKWKNNKNEEEWLLELLSSCFVPELKWNNQLPADSYLS